MKDRGVRNTLLVLLVALAVAWAYGAVSGGAPRDTAPEVPPYTTIIDHPTQVATFETESVPFRGGSAGLAFTLDHRNVSILSVRVTYTMQGPRCCADDVRMETTAPNGTTRTIEGEAIAMASLASYSQEFLAYEDLNDPPDTTYQETSDVTEARRWDAANHTSREHVGAWTLVVTVSPVPAEGQGAATAHVTIEGWSAEARAS